MHYTSSNTSYSLHGQRVSRSLYTDRTTWQHSKENTSMKEVLRRYGQQHAVTHPYHRQRSTLSCPMPRRAFKDGVWTTEGKVVAPELFKDSESTPGREIVRPRPMGDGEHSAQGSEFEPRFLSTNKQRDQHHYFSPLQLQLQLHSRENHLHIQLRQTRRALNTDNMMNEGATHIESEAANALPPDEVQLRALLKRELADSTQDDGEEEAVHNPLQAQIANPQALPRSVVSHPIFGCSTAHLR